MRRPDTSFDINVRKQALRPIILAPHRNTPAPASTLNRIMRYPPCRGFFSNLLENRRARQAHMDDQPRLARGFSFAPVAASACDVRVSASNDGVGAPGEIRTHDLCLRRADGKSGISHFSTSFPQQFPA